ncbi:WD40 repeat-like protein [Suillus hirtellus]|nr:WD40 repeat-like protein [Suillus hirtellus]
MPQGRAELRISTRRGEAPSHSSRYRPSAKDPPPYGAQHRQDALWEGGNEALPPMWHQFKTSSDGATLYQDNTLMIVSRSRPLPGVRLDDPGYLAVPGWEWHISPLGRSYFVNHDTWTTSWKKPKPERPAGSLMPECVIEGHSNYIWSLAYLGNSGNIMSTSHDSSIRQWKRDGEPVGKPLNSDGRGIGSMVVSPDETMVVCGGGDGRLRLWNIKEGSMIGNPWEGHNDAVRCLDWSRNSLEIVSGSQDGTIRRWNPNTGRQITPPIETSHGWIMAVKYSPKGDKFMSGGNGPICVWSRDGKLLIEIKGHDYDVSSLCWSRDGAHIFSASLDRTIRKWRAIDGHELVVLRGHTRGVKSFCLTPDERYIVSGSEDYTIRIWDLKTNQAVGDPLLHDDQLLALALSRDGKYIVSAGLDKKIYVWNLEAALKNGVVAAANPPTNSNTTRLPPIHARRIPPTFFDDFDIHSSTSPDVHHHSSHRIVVPSIESARALFARIPSLFHHSRSSAGDGLRQTRGQGIFFRRGPRAVQVAAVRDKQTLFVAPRPEQKQQQSSQLHSQGSSSQSQPTGTPTPVPNSSTQAPTAAAVTMKSRVLTVLARLVLLICCAPLPSTNGR